MSSFNTTHYIYYGSLPFHNSRFNISSINWRSASATELRTLSDETSGGATVLDSKDSAKMLTIIGDVLTTEQGITADDMQVMTREVKHYLKKKATYLRLIPKNKTLKLFTIASNTGWTTSGDASTVTSNTELYGNLEQTLKVVVDVSSDAGDSAGISNSSLGQVDITDYDGFDIPLYITDAYYVSNVTIRIGNDTSNYYQWDVSFQTLQQRIQNNHNLFSVKKSDAVETGTVTETAIDYFEVILEYSDQASDFEFELGNPYAFIDSYTENYTGTYKTGDLSFEKNQGLQGDITNQFTAQIYSPKEYSQSTFSDQEFSVTVTELQNTQSFEYEGSKSALPTTSISFDSNVSNITDFEIRSLNTGKTIAINDTSFVPGDVLTYNFKQRQVTKNNTPVYYTGLVEDFFVRGKNYVQLNIGQASLQSVIDNTSTSAVQESIIETGFNPLAAQSITPAGNGILTRVDVVLGVTSFAGGGFGGFSLSVYDDVAGSPGSFLAGSGLAFYEITTKKLFSFTGMNIPVTGGTKYWIVCQFQNLEGYIYGSASSNYAGGELKKSTDNGASWVTGSNVADAYFYAVLDNTPSHSLTWDLNNNKLDY